MPRSMDRHLWQHLDGRRLVLIALNIVAVIAGGLALDIRFGWWGQHAATVWTLAVWGWLYCLGRAEERRVLILCTAIAGIGEVVLSLGWGIYDYQFHNVPLFVPPGHALLMTLGLIAADKLVKLKAGRAFQAIFPWIAFIYAGFTWWRDFDRFGTLLFGVFAICMIFGRSKMLYATMFVAALLMELYGTALGNWRWIAVTPGLNLSAFNPPFSAGAFYCLLDLLVLAALTTWPPSKLQAATVAAGAGTTDASSR